MDPFERKRTTPKVVTNLKETIDKSLSTQKRMRTNSGQNTNPFKNIASPISPPPEEIPSTSGMNNPFKCQTTGSNLLNQDNNVFGFPLMSPPSEPTPSEYSMTSYSYGETEEEYVPKGIFQHVEEQIQDEIDAHPMDFQMPLTPESVNYNPFIPVVSRKLKDVIPVIPNYQAVKITKYRQSVQRNKMFDYKVPTHYIPCFSAYWNQFRILGSTLERKARKAEASYYDGVMVNVYKDARGRIYVNRMDATAEILGNLALQGKEFKYEVKVTHECPEQINPKVFPTQFLPMDSPYFTKLIDDKMEFPEVDAKWYSRKAEDNQWVQFRVDSRRYVHVKRNGVTIPIYFEGRVNPSSVWTVKTQQPK